MSFFVSLNKSIAQPDRFTSHSIDFHSGLFVRLDQFSFTLTFFGDISPQKELVGDADLASSSPTISDSRASFRNSKFSSIQSHSALIDCKYLLLPVPERIMQGRRLPWLIEEKRKHLTAESLRKLQQLKSSCRQFLVGIICNTTFQLAWQFRRH